MRFPSIRNDGGGGLDLHRRVGSSGVRQNCRDRVQVYANAWGKGNASEAAKSIIDHFGQAGGVALLGACVTRGPTPSLKLCERLGSAIAKVPQDLALWTSDDGDIVLPFDNAGNS